MKTLLISYIYNFFSEVAFPFFCLSFGQLRGYAMNLYAGRHQIEAKFGGVSLGNEIFCSENLRCHILVLLTQQRF